MRIQFAHNGLVYSMTEEEIEAAYRYRERQYRKEDARRQLEMFVFECPRGDLDKTVQDICIGSFENSYGVSYECIASELDSLVERFESRMDCNVDENETWLLAIESLIDDLRG